LSEAERVRLRSIADAIVAALFALSGSDLARILADSDLASSQLDDPHVSKGVNPVGFWRVDKEKDPELRHTVLTLVAFHDLEAKVQNCGGDCDKGIEAFLSQNDGEGWMLPETLRLADFGLGHDDRAKVHQPVASRLGPRFFDWQLTQSADESWRECHVHARNLLDEASYSRLLAPRSEGIQTADTSRAESDPRPPVSRGGKLFD
jgi:hypothetical protein